ncbi:DUF2274 domain-containing protein [Telmatospirillum sp.]|uniref:DUF2274 domain-containing protein n=1 Tax=Telmatospirillum sp. TaxID=2079197 RepID=UPI0028527C08|nr:DUF2274 domain-containing protein [Telmatospirillum sp.]
MAKLKISAIPDDRPVKVTLELPAALHRDLFAYAEILARFGGGNETDPLKLIPLMLARFMASDREFSRCRRERKNVDGNEAISTASVTRSAPRSTAERETVQSTPPTSSPLGVISSPDPA